MLWPYYDLTVFQQVVIDTMSVSLVKLKKSVVEGKKYGMENRSLQSKLKQSPFKS